MTIPLFVWTPTDIRLDGLIRAAALVHDWIYVCDGNPPDGNHPTLTGSEDELWEFYYPNNETKGVSDIYGAKWGDDNRAWSRRQADKMFKHMMLEAGMDKVRATLAYLGVRAGGWWV